MSTEWQAVDVLSWREQVDRQLIRLRQTVPFEFSPQEVYDGCMPADTKYIRLDHDARPGRMSNLMSTIVWNAAGSEAVLHVSVETEADYKEARKFGGGFKQVFWFYPPSMVPVPSNSHRTPFWMPLDHPLRQSVREWVMSATRVESDIHFAASSIDSFSKLSRTPGNLASLWPELMHFVHIKEGDTRVHRDANLMRQKFEGMMAKRLRDKIIDLLATAVMLQDRPPLPAWVGFHTQGL